MDDSPELPAPMTSDLSNKQISILQALWELRALGTHRVSLQQITSRLSEPLSPDIAEQLQDLENQGLITRSDPSDPEPYSLSLLGTACVRQLQDKELSDLGRNR
jgi:DNA-binding MarR family transcriptional regulator